MKKRKAVTHERLKYQLKLPFSLSDKNLYVAKEGMADIPQSLY